LEEGGSLRWIEGPLELDGRTDRVGNRDMSAEKVQLVDDSNWEQFLSQDYAVLVLTMSDCPHCRAWVEELSGFLEEDRRLDDVGFGKVVLDGQNVETFKAQNPWLEFIDGVPFTALYRSGEPKNSFHGSGVQRLVRKVTRLRDSE
jgi:hypothetical protein